MAEGKIYGQISLVMSEVGAIEKNRQNSQQGAGFMFRGIDDVYAALQPVLYKHKVFYVPEVIDQKREERISKNGGCLIYTTLRVNYTFYAEDGSSVKATVVGEAMDSGDKSSNKAMSAALKYALLQVFCIPTEEEKDADAQSHQVRPQNAQAPAQNRPPAQRQAAPRPSGPSPVQPRGGPPGAPAQRANPDGPTPGQIKRLFTIATSSRWTHEDVKKFMLEAFGKESTSTLNREEYNTICAFMPAHEGSAPPQRATQLPQDEPPMEPGANG